MAAAPEAVVWPHAPSDWLLEGAEAQVWAAKLDVAPSSLSRLRTTLSSAELDRAAQFHFEQDRNRFMVGRGVLRSILGRCLQIEAAKVEFAYGAQGKPGLAGAFAGSGLHFNLAHSEDLALVAVTRVGRVGVDVERVRLLPEAGELASRFFSVREIEALQTLPAKESLLGFFRLWTRKEAWLKGMGEGFGGSLPQVEAPLCPGAGCWELHDLSPAPGYAAALAVAVPGARLHCWQWADRPASPSLAR